MYEPKINDYVKWERDKFSVDGWVYFKSSDYITIEISTKPKHPEDLQHGTHHRNHRCLVVCYPQFWHQLRYIKTRNDIYSEK
jgi:hypothetical protein